MTAWQAIRRTLARLRERHERWRAEQELETESSTTSGPEPEAEPVAEAEDQAARLATRRKPFGEPGKPLDHRSPFFIGLTGALGVGVAYGLFQLLIAASDVLILIGLAVFVAIGLNPVVEWLTRRHLPRWAAVIVVLLAVVLVVGGFFAAAIPPLIAQGTAFAEALPRIWQEAQDRSSLLGGINDRFQIQERLSALLSGNTSTLLQGVIGAGRVVFGLATSVATVVVLTIYFLADLPRIRRTLYRLVPHSRRPRAILIGDEMFTRIGGFLLGTLITGLIAGVATFIWATIFGLPYPLLLSLFVAIMGLIPVIGSIIGGIVVTLAAFTVSLPVAIFTVGYIIAYRIAEDYLLFPKIMGKTVHVPAVTTVVAFVIGGALLGIVGAFVAIPVAAVISLILKEVLYPRLDRT